MGIRVPKIVVKDFDLNEGDTVLIKIEKIVETKHYRCRYCNHFFFSNEEVNYCPVCETERAIEEIKND